MSSWRARIGLIGPIESATEQAFHRYAPEGVGITTTRIRMRSLTVDGLVEFVDTMEEAAKVFRGYPKDIIIFGCTAASCIRGKGWDEECVRRLERSSGSPGTTTATAVLDAFRALGTSKVAMIAPYPRDITDIERDFFVANGVAITTADVMDTSAFGGEVDEGFIYRRAKAMNSAGAEAVFVSCMALETMGIIDALETDLGLPVVTSHQASLWSVLRKAGVKEKIPGIGKLFSL